MTAHPADNTANVHVGMRTCQPTHISASHIPAQEKEKYILPFFFFQLQTTSVAGTGTQLCKHVAVSDVASIYQM